MFSGTGKKCLLGHSPLLGLTHNFNGKKLSVSPSIQKVLQGRKVLQGKGKGTPKPEKIILNDTVECLQFKDFFFYYMYFKEANKTVSSKSVPFHSA